MLVVGHRLQERYQIEKSLQEGGMSVVYLATDTSLDARVAIKEMKDLFSNQEERDMAVAEFRKEAQILARLTHPGLPRVTNFFTERKHYYLVMDFIEGEALDRHLLRWGGTLPASVVLPWAWELCQVLDYLHNQSPPIIFRDLKPANIMVTLERRLKLIDFGIAKLFEPHKSTHTLIKGAGTPGFAPPEQYGSVGKSRTDARTDLYSMGATLYALVTGRIPPEATERWMGEVALKPPRQLNADVPPELDAVIVKCMELLPENRCQSVRELMTVLYPMVFGASRPATPPRAEPPPPTSMVPSSRDVQQQQQQQPPVARETRPLETPADALKDVLQDLPTEMLEARLRARKRRRHHTSPVMVGLLTITILILGVLVGSRFVVPNAAPSPGASSETPPSPSTPPPPPVAVLPTPPPPPPPPLSPSVTPNSQSALLLNVDPLGAEVTVLETGQTVVVGSGGYRLQLPPGTYTLKFQAPNYLTHKSTVQLKPGLDRLYPVKLRRAAELIVDSTPEGVLVKINGQKEGRTPLTLLDMAPGNYTVQLAADGYYARKEFIELKAGQSRRLHIHMQEIPPPPPVYYPPPPIYYPPNNPPATPLWPQPPSQPQATPQ